MTTPGGGGDRLEVGVVADATGFAKDAQAKIDAAVERIRAKIKVDIEYARLKAQAEAAAKRISKQTEIRLRMGVDKKYLLASMDAAVAEANAKNYAVKIKVDVDRKELDAALAAGGTVTVRRQVQAAASSAPAPAAAPAETAAQPGFLSRLMGRGKASVPVEADTTAAAAEVEAFRERVEHDPIDVPVEINQQSIRKGGRGIRVLTQNMTGLQKAGFYGGLLQTLASAAVAAGGGLFAMASAASQAVGVLGALPNAVGIAVQGMGALFAGFSGIGEAVGAMGKVQAAAGRAAGQSARQQEQAQKAIARARQAVVDAAEAGNRRIAQAERGVTEAQNASRRAQEALNQARKDAKEALEDYQLQLAGAALDEEGAALAVERAREAWNKAMRSPTSTALDRKEADLALRQAEQSLKEIQDRNEDLRDEAAAAEKAGIEGSVQVVAAKGDIVDAAQRERDAEQELSDARIDAVRGLQDAQDNLADAIASASDQMAAQQTAASNLAAAMAKLSPAGQEFARFLNDVVKPRMIAFRNAIQQQLLPGVQDAIKTLMTDPDPGRGLGSYLDVLQGGMEDTGKRMGVLASEGAKLMSSPGFREDTATIMKSNNRALSSFGEAGLSLVNILRHLAVAAGPVIERFARFVNTWMAGKSATLDTADGMERLTGFMERAGDRAAQLGRIVANLGRALFGLGKGGTEVGDSLIDKFDKLTQKWAGWANSTEGQKRIREFFEKIQPLFEAMGDTIAKVSKLIVQLGENGGGSVAGMLETINLILDALNWIAAGPLGPIISLFMQFGGVATILGLVGGKIAGLASSIAGGVSATSDFVKGLRGGAETASELGTTAAKVGSKIGDAFSAVGGFVDDAGRKIAQWGTNAAGVVSDWGTSAKQVASDWGTKIAETAAAAKTTISTWATNAGTALSGWATSAADTARRVGSSAATMIADAGRTSAAWATAKLKIVGEWVAMAAGAALNGLKIALVWTAQIVGQAVTGAAAFAVQAARVVGGWVLMGVQSLIQAGRMAAAWFIALGPLGWVIAAVLGIVALIIANWDTVKRVTTKVFSAIGEFISGIWSGLGNGLKAALNGIIRTINTVGIGAINLLISGVNLIPGVDIPKIPKIPLLAEGAIIRRPTLAMVGEDGPEAVIPLSASRADRRNQLLAQAGLATPDAGISGMGGWARLDSLGESRPLAELVATSGGAVDQATSGGNVGVLIQEGAVKQYITNPAPETASGTLNSGLRRVAAKGIFGSGSAS